MSKKNCAFVFVVFITLSAFATPVPETAKSPVVDDANVVLDSGQAVVYDLGGVYNITEITVTANNRISGGIGGFKVFTSFNGEHYGETAHVENQNPLTLGTATLKYKAEPSVRVRYVRLAFEGAERVNVSRIVISGFLSAPAEMITENLNILTSPNNHLLPVMTLSWRTGTKSP